MELHVTEYAVDEHVAIVRLNRPGRGNSWTARMNAEYRWLMDRADQDPQVRVIVVTGGGRQFCVGADFKALDHYSASDQDYVASIGAQEMARPGHGIRPEYDHELVWQWGMTKPVIAAVNGACAGIAVGLVAFCDLRFAVAGAKFTTAAPRLGLPAEYGLSWILPRIVGLTHAADILLTGRIFTSEEAFAMGFLNGVHPEDGFAQHVLDFAKGLAKSVAPHATKTAKRQLYAELMSHDVGLAIEESKSLIGAHMKHPDYAEGVNAMKEKRSPHFLDPQ